MRNPRYVLRGAVVLGGLCALPAALSAQAYVKNNSVIPTTAPFNNSFSEHVDFGDIDLDGDWDALFGDGGDQGNDQNRLWINQGGLQAGTKGVFLDDTSNRLPAFQDDSRDVEFADIDDDGDLDVYTSNTAQISNQGNRWLINQGFDQGGTIGNFVDETGSRWVGLNSANSSVPTSLLLPNSASPETFIDWSCDCDFADMDNDGDLDLFHSTYGGAFGGNAPSRVFLNDGDGFFEEFNPSGFKLTTTNMPSGQPGLWSEGNQQSNTGDTSGSFCDITGSALDIDLADIDGDLDIDIMHGSRESPVRMFQNRFEEKGGVLGFRDITSYSWPTGSSSGGGNYEQEFGDFENDGDIDVYGLNWVGFTDIVAQNDGTGKMLNKVNLPGSGADDNEGDFVDYDNDGDLDIYVGNFSGSDKLYQNRLVETGNPTFVLTTTPAGQSPGLTTLDIDACDTDGDGDYDVMSSMDNGQTNDWFENVTNTPDTHAPVMYRLENPGNDTSSAVDDVVRVQVYDNAPYYITWYNETTLRVLVDGVRLPELPMKSSAGQIFRGEVPGNLVGDIQLNARSKDEYGNSALSDPVHYTNTGPVGVKAGSSSPSSVGTPNVRALSSPIEGKPLYLIADTVASHEFGAWLFSTQTSPGLDLGDGLILNVGPAIIGEPVLVTTDSDGESLLALPTMVGLSGFTIHTQFFAADGVGVTWASSQRLELLFQ